MAKERRFYHTKEDTFKRLENYLKYNQKVPSYKEDSRTNSWIKDLYKRYKEEPIIQELEAKYPVPKEERKEMTYMESIIFMQEKLKRYKKVPGPSIDRPLYSKVKYFYENYSEDPRVKELMEKYPLVKKIKPSIYSKMSLDEKINFFESRLNEEKKMPKIFVRHRMDKENSSFINNLLRLYEKECDHPKVQKLLWKYPSTKHYEGQLKILGSIFTYISYVISIYNELPGEDTQPMEALSDLCKEEGYKLYNEEGSENEACNFVKKLYDKGFINDRINLLKEKIGF